MTITFAEALSQLNIVGAPGDPTELQLYVNAANEWVAKRVSDTSPAPVRLATLMLLDHLWETQRGPASNPVDEELGTPGSFGFAVPNRVLELLAPYMTSGTGRKPAASSYSFPDAVAFPDAVESPAP